MNDYIKREDAARELRSRAHRFTVADERGQTRTTKWSEDVIYLTAAMNGLMSVRAADVVERKHGKWVFGCDEETGEQDLYAWTCSLCGEKYPWQPNFCPNCGAQMESEGE